MAQDLSSAILIVLVIAVAVAFFWRTVIRLAAVGTVTMPVLGFFEIPPGMTLRPIDARADRFERMHFPARLR